MHAFALSIVWKTSARAIVFEVFEKTNRSVCTNLRFDECTATQASHFYVMHAVALFDVWKTSARASVFRVR